MLRYVVGMIALLALGWPIQATGAEENIETRQYIEGEMSVPVYQLLAAFDQESMMHVISPTYTAGLRKRWRVLSYGKGHDIKIVKIQPPYVYAKVQEYSPRSEYPLNLTFKIMVRKEGNKYYVVPAYDMIREEVIELVPWEEVP